jgi:hypothetical protein
VLCIVGLVSFGIEGSHRIWSHELSWIASFPVVMVPLAAVAAWQYRSVGKPLSLELGVCGINDPDS